MVVLDSSINIFFIHKLHPNLKYNLEILHKSNYQILVILSFEYFLGKDN